MEEVHRTGALGAEACGDLISDPERTIAGGVRMTVRAKPATMAQASSCRPATATLPLMVAP